MPTFNVDVTYSPNFWRRFEPSLYHQAVSEALRKAAPYVVSSAQSNANFVMGYETGKLKASIMSEQPSANVVVFRAPATNESGRPYGQYVELGTGRGPAQPFLVPAVRDSLPLVKSMIRDEIRSVR